MNMKKLTTLLLTATLGLASGAALAADTGAQSNNGRANSSADAGQVAPDARENVAPNNVDNSQINSGSGGTTGSTMTQIICRAMRYIKTRCVKTAAVRTPVKNWTTAAIRPKTTAKPTAPPSNT